MTHDYFEIKHDTPLHNANPDMVPMAQMKYTFSTEALGEDTMTDLLVLSLSQKGDSAGLNILEQVCPYVSTC